MSNLANSAATSLGGVRPSHVLAGLGSADRRLLAVCLALFEDSAFLRRLEQVYENIGRWVQRLAKEDVREAAASVQTRMSFWFDSRLSDNELRLILWIYMREAFGLPARLTVSTRGAEAMAAELAAVAIRAGDVLKKGETQYVTLADLVASVMQELMAAALEDGAGELDEASKEQLIAETRSRLRGMGEADLKRLLAAVGAEELNDAAIRKILLTSGGLTAFGAGVGMAGFSAYVLAAQASAFIPLVSGPALVSAVAVVANPITVIAATGIVAWWAISSATTTSQLAVGLRVIALLALQGVNEPTGLANALKTFLGAKSLQPYGDLDSETVFRYETAAINPAVMEAADFSRLADVHGPIDFASLAQEIFKLSSEGSAGAISSLKGYVAERLVAAELVGQGHDVSFPETPNESGWDILVDGHKFQVKWQDSQGGLEEHFGKYEYPILANSELAGKIPPEWADKVFFVEGYSDELVTHVTERSVEAGADVLNPDIPVFALSISAARNLMAYQAGSVSAVQAAEQIALDGGTRAGLAVAGNYAGTAIGLLIFGPAGGLVLGTVVPILSQMQAGSVKQWLDEYVGTNAYKDWEAKAHGAVDALVGCLRAEVQCKLKRLRTKYRAFPGAGIRAYIRVRLEDEAAFLRESSARLERLSRDGNSAVETRSMDVIRWIAASTIHPVAYQSEMLALQVVLATRPPLSDRATEIAGDIKEGVEDFFNGVMEWLNPTKPTEDAGKDPRKPAKVKPGEKPGKPSPLE